jgi:hypothetical protein
VRNMLRKVLNRARKRAFESDWSCAYIMFSWWPLALMLSKSVVFSQGSSSVVLG